MLPELKQTQSVFVEITNPIHGGAGWEFGSCLWSPARDRRKAEADCKDYLDCPACSVLCVV